MNLLCWIEKLIGRPNLEDPAIDLRLDLHDEAIEKMKKRQQAQEQRLRRIESSRDVLQRRYPK